MFTSLNSFNFVSLGKGQKKPETTGSVANKPSSSVETAGSLAYSTSAAASTSAATSSAASSSSSSGSFCAVA